MSTKIVRLASVLAVLLAGRAAAANAADTAELGQVAFPNSGAPAAQEPFLRGVAALHSFWYDEAAKAFREAQKADPGFALAYWGEAMTYNHPIWSEQDKPAALAALARLGADPAARAARAPTDKEKAWLAAVETLYGSEKPAADRAYAASMRSLHERWPDDLEAASFYSLSLIGPALTGGATGPDRDRDLMKAAGILEELSDRVPRHPGVLHYLIHAYDDPVHAPLGLRAARIYAEVAPAAHHALHMPSHIFVQLGRWPDAAASNEAAWAASVDWVKREKLALEKRDFHSLSWLAYVYLQQGKVKKAEETLEIARQAMKDGVTPRAAYSLRSMEARHLVETGRGTLSPAVASAEPKGEAEHCGAHAPGDDAILQARGMTLVRARDLAAARTIAEELIAGGKKDGDAAWTIPGKQIQALAFQAEGKMAEALELLKESAALESALPPPSGPPVPLKPAHELYGEMLLEAGKPEEAARQFELSLQRTPNRAASLLGAARAATRLGDAKTARRHYAVLAEMWKQADADQPGLAEARGR